MTRSPAVLVLKLGLLYFTIVFAAGFVLGVIRVYLLIPYLGLRMAELAEMPFMLVVMILAAHWVVKRMGKASGSAVLGVGLLALGLLLVAEVGLALLVQEQSLWEFIMSRDPVSGSVYLFMLGLFALLPSILRRFCPS